MRCRSFLSRRIPRVVLPGILLGVPGVRIPRGPGVPGFFLGTPLQSPWPGRVGSTATKAKHKTRHHKKHVKTSIKTSIKTYMSSSKSIPLDFSNMTPSPYISPIFSIPKMATASKSKWLFGSIGPFLIGPLGIPWFAVRPLGTPRSSPWAVLSMAHGATLQRTTLRISAINSSTFFFRF